LIKRCPCTPNKKNAQKEEHEDLLNLFAAEKKLRARQNVTA
jgi:hypothetical protein